MIGYNKGFDLLLNNNKLTSFKKYMEFIKKNQNIN
jgi:hypothetical protein